MLEKFFILHRTGRCILSKSFGERSIHLSLLHSLVSSTSTLLAFSKRHHNEFESNSSASTEELSTHLSRSTGFDRGKATTIAFGELQFVFLDVGPFLLVAQALRGDRNETVTRIVFEVHKTMTFYLGTFSAVAHDDTVVEGILDYIEHVLEHTRNLRWLVDGLNMVPLDSRTLSTLDRLMATFEENESVSGSLMVIGKSVLHSRMPVPEALAIVQHLSCRPMNQAAVRMIPVFVKEKAQHLIFVRINAITLALLTDIRTSFSELVPYVEHFECALEEDAFQLPKEEPSILLRHFTGHDTLAFLFHDEESGITVAPAPRVGPSGEQNIISNRFRWFYNEVRTNMASSGIENLTIQSDEHVFHFHSGKGTQLYTLFSRKVDHSMLDTLTAEIIDNIGRVITLQ